LEDALLRTLAAEPILARIRSAMRDKRIAAGDPELRVTPAIEAGIISLDEAAVVQGAIVARRQVIEVDDFSPEQLNPQLDTGTPQWNSDPQNTASAAGSM
jgi:acyl-CoA dehydrogenase